MLELYKDGDQMAIITDATTEDEFTDAFAQAIGSLIASGAHAGDWYFQFTYWLPQYAEIICKLRGYKSSVRTRTVIEAGGFTPNASTLEARINERGDTVIPESQLIKTAGEP